MKKKYIYIYIHIYIYLESILFLFLVVQEPLVGPRPPQWWGFDITHRHTTLGKNPPDEGSARLRHHFIITLNIHNRQTNISPAGFEPAIPNKRAAVSTRITGPALFLLTKDMFQTVLEFRCTTNYCKRETISFSFNRFQSLISLPLFYCLLGLPCRLQPPLPPLWQRPASSFRRSQALKHAIPIG